MLQKTRLVTLPEAQGPFCIHDDEILSLQHYKICTCRACIFFFFNSTQNIRYFPSNFLSRRGQDSSFMLSFSISCQHIRAKIPSQVFSSLEVSQWESSFTCKGRAWIQMTGKQIWRREKELDLVKETEVRLFGYIRNTKMHSLNVPCFFQRVFSELLL